MVLSAGFQKTALSANRYAYCAIRAASHLSVFPLTRPWLLLIWIGSSTQTFAFSRADAVRKAWPYLPVCSMQNKCSVVSALKCFFRSLRKPLMLFTLLSILV